MNWLPKTSLGLIFTLTPLSLAIAQSNQEPVDLGKVDVVEQVDSANSQGKANYENGEGVDNGKAVISSTVIKQQSRGDINTSELLKTLPFVQMDINRRGVSNESVQNLRPSDFTISGGSHYNNNIMINGVGANSIMDVTDDNPYNFNEVAGQTSQTLYVEPSLIGEITVHDSNVSAQYGGFTGGVVELDIRQPKDHFSLTVSAGYQSDSQARYILDPEHRDADAEDIPAKPVFTKYKTSISVDLPVNDKLKLLAAYSRTESDVDYVSAESYGSIKRPNGDTSENFLLKGVYEISKNLQAEAQVIYSPFSSTAQNRNGIDNKIDSKSDGLSGYFKLSGNAGDIDWNSQLSYSLNTADRKTENSHFSWPSASDYVDWCSSSNCSRGGFGNLDQEQENISWDIKASQPLWQGELSYGIQITHIDASKTRPQDNFSYNRGKVFDQLECPTGDIACISNDVVLEQYNYYKAYDANASVTNNGIWIEYQKEIGQVDVRGGLRYSYDNFLHNGNFEPRFVTSWEFMPETSITFGVNRYFAKNNVSYAIRSQYPDNYIYRRDTNTDSNGVEQVEPWSLYRHTRPAKYAQADLETPYTDELSLAFEIPTPLNGKLRIKGIQRDHKDKFARSPRTRLSYDRESGGTSTFTEYSITNEGETDYKAVAFEWITSYKNHSLSFNTTWTEKKNKAGQGDYFDEVDNEELYNEFVYYRGRIITKGEAETIKSAANFASPIRASLNWNANWMDGKLVTTTSVYYRSSYETLDDTNANITVDGERFDVYDVVKRQDYTPINLNAQYELFSGKKGKALIEIRIDNLFNSSPHNITRISNPYQEGRSYWIGASYTY